MCIRDRGWIVLSVICFAAGLLKERALLLLLPLYLILSLIHIL